MKRNTTLAASVFLLAGVAPLSAHDTFRIIGTITKADQFVVEVKTKEGEIVTVRLDAGTSISRARKKADVFALKTGGSIVVDALGDTVYDLVALDVRIVPSITSPSK
jgi:hypothetical protein